MKRVILCASALLAGGIAFAQAPPQTDKEVVNVKASPAVVTPTSRTILTPSPNSGKTAGGNHAESEQQGTKSSNFIYQVGTDQSVYIDQTGTNAVTRRNTIDIEQNGNVSATSGVANYADLIQNGSGNDLDALQLGDNNNLNSLQVGDLNKAVVQQGAIGAQQAQNNLATVDQSGERNSAEVQQRYDNNKSSITQSNLAGEAGNRSYQEQIADPNMTTGHTAVGIQDGDSNDLVQIQNGPGSTSLTGNYAYSSQGVGSTANPRASNGFVQQLQSGTQNDARAEQFGTDNSAFQEQDGDGNIAFATQTKTGTDAGNHDLEQFQDGDRNSAYTEQIGADNKAFTEQRGDDNVANINQQNGANFALSMQNGDNNFASILQHRAGNSAIVDQLGDNHSAVIDQKDNTLGAFSNSSIIVQRAANDTSARQTQMARATKRKF